MTDDVKRRYLSDPNFHAVVESLRMFLQQAKLAPSEVREAAMLACIIEEERKPAMVFCTCLSISRDPLCFYHGDRDKLCCDGNDPACPTHGVVANNARQNERMR